jgi:hypothetical protein
MYQLQTLLLVFRFFLKFKIAQIMLSALKSIFALAFEKKFQVIVWVNEINCLLIPTANNRLDNLSFQGDANILCCFGQQQ